MSRKAKIFWTIALIVLGSIICCAVTIPAVLAGGYGTVAIFSDKVNPVENLANSIVEASAEEASAEAPVFVAPPEQSSDEAPAPVAPAQEPVEEQSAAAPVAVEEPLMTGSFASLYANSYPSGGTKEQQEAYVSELFGCEVTKSDGEAALFKVSVKNSNEPQLCVNAAEFLTTLHLGQQVDSTEFAPVTDGIVLLSEGDNQTVPVWAGSIRVMSEYENDTVCSVFEGESVNRINEQHPLYVSAAIDAACNQQAFDLSDADPDKALETASIEAAHGLYLIRISGTDDEGKPLPDANSFHATSIDFDEFVLRTQNGFSYEVTMDNGTHVFAVGNGFDFSNVSAVIIYPDTYFTTCEAYALADGATANSSFDPSSCTN